MDTEDNETNSEKQIVVNYAKRIDAVLNKKGISSDAPVEESKISFPIGKDASGIDGTWRLAILGRLTPEQIEEELKFNDKQLPTTIPYFELTAAVPGRRGTGRSYNHYFLNLEGEGGVLRIEIDSSSDKNNPANIENLTTGDYENIEWILQDIEAQL